VPYVLVLTGISAVLLISSAHAAMYRCTNAAGTMVITDSPVQLRGCFLLGTSQPTTPTQPDSTPTPPPLRATEPEPPRDHQAPTPLFTVPLERLGSLWVVTVQVNGTRSAKLILDTGASHTMLSYAVARDLVLWAQGPSTSMTMQTAGGTVQVNVVPIASISLGGAEVRNTVATIYDLPEAPPGVEGLLGQEFLRHFEVTLNAEKGELRLRSAK
jgi:clan AA aspartic protease (TIGR02281 family)